MYVARSTVGALHLARSYARTPTGINTSVLHRMSQSASSAAYRTVATPNAPSAIGPYSQAVIHNKTVYMSGCIPFDPKTMQVVEGGIEEQTKQALSNLMAVAEASGADKSRILKVTVFLKDMNDFAKVNAIYEQPARSAVEVARLPRDVLVEMEAIAATAD